MGEDGGKSMNEFSSFPTSTCGTRSVCLEGDGESLGIATSSLVDFEALILWYVGRISKDLYFYVFVEM